MAKRFLVDKDQEVFLRITKTRDAAKSIDERLELGLNCIDNGSFQLAIKNLGKTFPVIF